MANICDFEMFIRGDAKSIDEFLDVLSYQAPKEKFCRMWDFDCHTHGKVVDSDEDYAFISGNCAHSVYCCMVVNGDDCVTLQELSKRLNLFITVESYEGGIGFSEYYVYDHGNELINNCVDYVEVEPNELSEFSEDEDFSGKDPGDIIKEVKRQFFKNHPDITEEDLDVISDDYDDLRFRIKDETFEKYRPDPSTLEPSVDHEL